MEEENAGPSVKDGQKQDKKSVVGKISWKLKLPKWFGGHKKNSGNEQAKSTEESVNEKDCKEPNNAENDKENQTETESLATQSIISEVTSTTDLSNKTELKFETLYNTSDKFINKGTLMANFLQTFSKEERIFFAECAKNEKTLENVYGNSKNLVRENVNFIIYTLKDMCEATVESILEEAEIVSDRNAVESASQKEKGENGNESSKLEESHAEQIMDNVEKAEKIEESAEFDNSARGRKKKKKNKNKKATHHSVASRPDNKTMMNKHNVPKKK